MKNIYILNTFKYCESNAFLATRIKNFFTLNNCYIVNNPAESDTIIIATCGFDSNRQITAKNQIFEITNKYSDKEIIVTGCLPGINPDYFSKLKIKTINLKELEKFDNYFHSETSINNVSTNKISDEYLSQNYGFSNDYYIQISVGCANDCSYCVIKNAKGDVKSKPINQIISELSYGIECGKKHFILLADDCGSYGADLHVTLVDLFNEIDKIKNTDFKISLNYIYPGALISMFPLLRKEVFQKIHFLNISIQSVSLRILAIMNRHYDPEQVFQITKLIKTYNPKIIFHTHVIYGYPTESRQEFLDSFKLIDYFDKIIFFHFTETKKNELYVLADTLSYSEIMYRAFTILQYQKSHKSIAYGGYLNYPEKNKNKIFNIIREDYKHTSIDVLLIFPRADENNFISYPLSLLSISQPLIDNGFNVEILDERLEPDFLTKIDEIVQNNKLICIGFTTLSGTTLKSMKSAIEHIKNKNLSIPIVVGGSFATLYATELMKFNSIDYIIKGEGEISFLQFIQAIQNNLSIKNIQGVVYRQKEEIISNPVTDTIDINKYVDLPFYLLFKYNSLYKNIFIQTSRGCPFGCKFCTIPVLFGKNYRRMNNNNILKLIHTSLMLTNDDVKIVFVDDNFFINIKESIELAKEIISYQEKGIFEKFSWWAEIRADTLLKFSKSELKLLKKAGLSQLFLGVESGSDRTLEKTGKNFNTKTILKANKLLKKMDIEAQYSFVVGFPFETKDDYDKTISLINTIKKKNPKAQIWKLNKYVAFPGTPLTFEYKDALMLDINNYTDFYASHYDEVNQTIKLS